MSTTKPSLHDTITNQIVSDLEQGILVWEKPYNGGLMKLPKNPSTGKHYQGINTLILWATAQRKQYQSNQWLTFKQALDLGMSVRKGEKATPVVFYKTLTFDRDTEDERNIPMLRQYSVFNLEQIEGAEKLIESNDYQKTEIEKLASAEKLMSLAKVSHHLSHSPCFVPSQDIIKLPLVEQFKSQIDYYATALHELTHWTGHKDRLHRFKLRESKQDYAFEELIAELGASFLCAELGLPYTTQHAAYVQSWLKALRDDKTLIFKAAAQAQKAVNMVLEKSGLKSIEQTENQNEGAA